MVVQLRSTGGARQKDFSLLLPHSPPGGLCTHHGQLQLLLLPAGLLRHLISTHPLGRRTEEEDRPRLQGRWDSRGERERASVCACVLSHAHQSQVSELLPFVGCTAAVRELGSAWPYSHWTEQVQSGGSTPIHCGHARGTPAATVAPGPIFSSFFIICVLCTVTTSWRNQWERSWFCKRKWPHAESYTGFQKCSRSVRKMNEQTYKLCQAVPPALLLKTAGPLWPT